MRALAWAFVKVDQPEEQSPQTASVPLRMSGLFEVTLRLFRRQPGTIIGLGAIAGFTGALANLVGLATLYPRVRDQLSALEPLASDPQAADQPALAMALLDLVVNSIGLVLMVLLVSLPIYAIVNALVIRVASQDAAGTPTRAGQAWGSVRSLVWRLLGQVVVIVAIVAVCGVPFVAAVSLRERDPMSALGLAFVVAPMCLLAIGLAVPRLVLAPVCLVVEGGSVNTSLMRARELVRGNTLRVLAVVMVAFVVTRVLTSIVSLPFGLLAGAETMTTQAIFFSSMGRAAGTALTLPLLSLLSFVLYIDLRVRREGPVRLG